MQALLKIILFLFLSSCAMTKESKRIKKGSGIIQDSNVLLYAEIEGAVSFMNLALRENNFFSIMEGAMFGWDYYAGTWREKNDTILLDYIDDHKRSDFLNFVVINDDILYMPRQDSLISLPLTITWDRLSFEIEKEEN